MHHNYKFAEDMSTRLQMLYDWIGCRSNTSFRARMWCIWELLWLWGYKQWSLSFPSRVNFATPLIKYYQKNNITILNKQSILLKHITVPVVYSYWYC